MHVLNVVVGCIASDLGTGSTHELKEERRLLYVAMTMARDELHILLPQRLFVTQQVRNGDGQGRGPAFVRLCSCTCGLSYRLTLQKLSLCRRCFQSRSSAFSHQLYCCPLPDT